MDRLLSHQMMNRRAVFLCNLKPAKMRGILSEGMIMCASTPEKVEIINPPEGSTVGDRIIVDGYACKCDDMFNSDTETTHRDVFSILKTSLGWVVARH